jgi:hypothetical protein
MIELMRLVEDFAMALERADGRHPRAIGARTGRAYQPGIGPHSEAETIKLVVDELAAQGLPAAQTQRGVPGYLASAM